MQRWNLFGDCVISAARHTLGCPERDAEYSGEARRSPHVARHEITLREAEGVSPHARRCRCSAQLLGESDEKPFRPADVAEPIDVFILDNVAHELRAALAEPLERVVDVVDGKHDA